MNLFGTLKQQVIFSLIKLAIELLVAFFMAMASTQLVNSLVTTNIQMHPSEWRFIGPMKSISQLWRVYGAIVRWRLWWLVCISFPRL